MNKLRIKDLPKHLQVELKEEIKKTKIKVQTQLVKDKMKPFINYCWDFYGPKGIYGDFFKGKLTKKKLIEAIRIRMCQLKTTVRYGGDTMDRELVRDILFKMEDKNAETEFKIKY